jgi:Lrp/AsnC family transcriptional regulator for asnA, asnC and gidA
LRAVQSDSTRIAQARPPAVSSRGARLDSVDRAIIEALQKNGREAFRRIATSVGVSEATIRARYARLRQSNVLQVTGVTNPLELGFEAQAMVGIRTSGAPDEVANEISSWEEAGYVVVTAGQFDVLVELVCADRRHLIDLTGRIRSLPGVVSTESFLYLELWKQVYDWGTRPRDASAAGERDR